MALFGMQIKSRRKAGIGGFHADYLNDRTAMRQRKQMGYLRTVFSAFSLLFGGFMIYVSMHYIPAMVQPQKILKFASESTVHTQTYDFDRKSKAYKIFGPYIEMFKLERAYMRPGQSVEIKYDLPSGASAKLDIYQCRRAWIVEIFDCRVVSKFSTKTKKRTGVASFALKQGGFYHFKQDVVGVPEGESYRIVWERGL